MITRFAAIAAVLLLATSAAAQTITPFSGPVYGVPFVSWPTFTSPTELGTTSCLAVYGLGTSTSTNLERVRLCWNGTQYDLFSEKAGTGANRDIRIGSGAGPVWTISVAGDLSTSNSAGSSSLLMGQSGTFGIGGRVVLSSGANGRLLMTSSTGALQQQTTQTTAPTCSSNCGTSPTVTGTDSNGRVNMGASGVPASGWVLTFNGTWVNAPQCDVWMSKAGMVTGKKPITMVTTTTTITVTTDGTAPGTSDTYDYRCATN